MELRMQARNRRLVLIGLTLVVALGLLSRLVPVFGSYPGDILWATAVYLGWALLFPRIRAAPLVLLALATAYLVEFSQMYQASWIMALRSHTLGRLFLGTTFYWPDLIAYTVGVMMGSLTDRWLCSKK